MEDCNNKAACLGRREFLVKVGIVAGATVLTVSSAALGFASGRFEDVVVPIAADSPLAKMGGSQIVASSAGKIIVIRSGEQKFAAFSARCTHKGTLLNYDGKQLKCPNHGSKFNAEDGSVIGGPADSPVNSYPVKPGDGSVTVAVG